MKLIHVFEEDKTKLRKLHAKFWFGMTPLDHDEFNEDDGSFVACYCGGRVYPMEWDGDDISVGAIWHLKKFKDVDEL